MSKKRLMNPNTCEHTKESGALMLEIEKALLGVLNKYMEKYDWADMEVSVHESVSEIFATKRIEKRVGLTREKVK